MLNERVCFNRYFVGVGLGIGKVRGVVNFRGWFLLSSSAES